MDHIPNCNSNSGASHNSLMLTEQEFLASIEPDPVKPEAGQHWQDRESGRVELITHIDHYDIYDIVNFRPDGSRFIIAENLITRYRYVGDLPEAAWTLNGKLVMSWREMAICMRALLPKPKRKRK